VSRTCPRWLEDSLVPKKPKHTCITRSVTLDPPYHPKWSKSSDWTPGPDGPGYCNTYPFSLPFPDPAE
jgi:hypothetical protein